MKKKKSSKADDFMKAKLLSEDEAIAFVLKKGLTREQAERILDQLCAEGKAIEVQ